MAFSLESVFKENTWLKLAVCVVSFVAITTYMGIWIVPYAVILMVIGLTVFARGPLSIWVISACMILSVSMLGHDVVGSDIHAEFFLAKSALVNGWNPAYFHLSNTSIVIWLFAPFLAVLTGGNMLIVFKLILPIVFSLTPVLLYHAFSKQVGRDNAYFAVLFFIFMPVGSMEITAIVKSQVAEVCFATVIFLMVSKIRFKVLWIALLIFIAVLSHYTIGIIILGYLMCMLMAPVVSKLFLADRNFTLKSVFLCIAVLAVAGIAYYMFVGNGIVAVAINNIFAGQSYVPSTVSGSGNPVVASNPIVEFINSQRPLVKLATGIDFVDASVAGKVFRIIQYCTQIFVIIGLLVFRKYRFSAEFITCMFGSFCLLCLCIIVPSVGSMINVTRLYHLSLFFLAPAFAIGASYVFKDRRLVVLFLVVYFIFTSGLVFEVSRSTNTVSLDTPYSISLSGDRLGFAGIYTQDDVSCAKWLQDKSGPVVADYNGQLLLLSYIPEAPRIMPVPNSEPYGFGKVKSGTYILMTSWNMKNNMIVEPYHIGLRSFARLPDILSKSNVVYQSGLAKVYLYD